MDRAEHSMQSQQKLIEDLRQVIENAEELMKNTEQYTSALYQGARVRLAEALTMARSELAHFEDAQLTCMIEATRAANDRCNDMGGEAQLLRAFDFE